ncbi:MAG: TonB C-terminal domain-containing protein [Candidatus Rokubacteria bacterium]|nr:TonB C-terminal domain-containing protein [Candidatus Rokubacteria bacterium]
MESQLSGRHRQWLRVGLLASIAGHLLVVALLAFLWDRPVPKRPDPFGDPLIVELPRADDLMRAGDPAIPPEPTAPPPRPAVAAPAPPRPAPRPARPAPPPTPARPAPEPPRVASAPPAPPKAPAPPPPPDTREAAPVPAPPPPTPAAKPSEPTAPAPAAEPAPATPGAPAAPAPRVAAVPPGGSDRPPARPVPDLRTALRRGGPGGFGEGQRGAYGNPIALDTKEDKYVDYFSRIRPMIQSKWSFPCPDGDPAGRDCTRREGQLIAEMGVAKDGRLTYLVLLDSSGSRNMDDAALTAVKLAGPFPPVPDSVGRSGIGITVTFRYMIVDELANIRMR